MNKLVKSLRHDLEGKNVEGRAFTPYEVELYSKFWGEGSEILTNLLRYCLENNITTQACCKGHPKIDNLNGYIFFSGNNEYFVKFISYKILTEGYPDDFSYGNISAHKLSNGFDFLLYFEPELRDKALDHLLGYIAEYKKLRDTNKLKDFVDENYKETENEKDVLNGINRVYNSNQESADLNYKENSQNIPKQIIIYKHPLLASLDKMLTNSKYVNDVYFNTKDFFIEIRRFKIQLEMFIEELNEKKYTKPGMEI